MTGNLVAHLLRSWRHHLTLQLATIGVLSLVLLILSMVLGFRENLSHLNALWGDNLELTVYLKENAPAQGVALFVKDLSVENQLGQVKLVDKEEALQRFVARMGDLAPDFVRSPEFENPLPALVEIHLKSGSTAAEKVEAMKALAARLSANELVSDVSYGHGWIENWAAFLTSVQWISRAAVVLTMLMGLLIVGNSVRVSLSQRREEIEIMELVGATAWWIRLPFVVEGALTGVCAFAIAAMIGRFLQAAILGYLRSSLTFWSITQEMQPLSTLGWVIVAAVGIGFGTAGAYACLRHLNSGWSAAERWDK